MRTKVKIKGMRIPSFLSQGDTIGIVSVSNKINFDLDANISVIEEWGFYVKRGKTLSSAHHQFSGTDAERTADLQDMLDDKEVKCILFACGGYGAARIIDGLNFNAFMDSPKWIAGYSDVTVLHIFLKEKLGMASIHSPMLMDMKKNTNLSIESLCSVLQGHPIKYALDSHPKNRAGLMLGEICGGNLSLIYSLMGSPSGLSTSDSILFIEDVGEKLYHIDRMMVNLKRSGKLKGLKGLICGSFSSMKDNAIPFGKELEDIILEHVSGYDFPILFDFPAGHIDNNLSFILGCESTLSIENKEVTFIQNNSAFV